MIEEAVKRKVWVIQKPPKISHFDMGALDRLGEVNYIIPSAPNVHEQERILEDYARMLKTIENAAPEDIFLPLGGSPFSNWLFGAALYASGRENINTAVYSRDQDKDGRRFDTGNYRIINMATHFPEEEKVA
jgi:hypothetical protein